ncbi:MAG: XrtA-associated tyrosine autokinase [Pseudomonadota bacterium]
MSKLQDALRKLQDGKPPATKTSKRVDGQAQYPKNIASVIRKDQGDVSGNSIAIDRKALRDAGLLAPETDEQQLANEYRHIKRPLIAHAFGKRATKVKDGNLIMVASALPGEGKTFTCVNLALSMAQEQDHSVVLVDADVAKPHITELFGATNEPGLLDVLDEPDRDLGTVLMKTDVPWMSVIPAGKPRRNSTELVSSLRMEQIVFELSNRYPDRIVLFDSPPLLLTNESKVLASLMGQIVLVIRAEQTPRNAVEEAVSALDESKAINVILNQVRHRHGHGAYYGAYGSYGDNKAYTRTYAEDE